MLVTLKHPLETGQTVKATLKFDKAGTVDVDYPVVAIGAPAVCVVTSDLWRYWRSGAMETRLGARRIVSAMSSAFPITSS